MISALDVYLVMQLDSLRSFLGFVGVFVLLSSGFALTFSLDFEKITVKAIRWCAAAGAAAFLLSAVLPSTQTAAAMIILPRIANNSMVQGDAKEFYTLAVGALREALGKKPDESK